MNALLPPCVLALLGGLCAAQSGASEVHLDVLRGRAILVTEHGVLPITVQRAVEPFRGQGHLELAPGSRAVLRWAGVGSVNLYGPASVAWYPIIGGSVDLDFQALATADVEVRRAALKVDLPGAWRLELKTGAYALKTLGAGGIEFTHLAGGRARASWTGSRQVAPPPSTIQAGQQLVLQDLPEFNLRSEQSAPAQSWTRTSWPWGSGVIAGAPELKLPGVPAWQADTGAAEWPWGSESADVEPWERWDWPWTAAHLKPQDPPQVTPQVTPSALPDPAPSPHPILPQGASPHGIQHLRQLPELRVSSGAPSLSSTEPEPQKSPSTSPPTFDRSLWRGLGEAQILKIGNYRVQVGRELQRVTLKNGDTLLWLEPDASRPYWYFSRRLDVRLFPGAKLMVGENGYLRYHTGTVRILSAREGRAF